jgi:hypothetical protein
LLRDILDFPGLKIDFALKNGKASKRANPRLVVFEISVKMARRAEGLQDIGRLFIENRSRVFRPQTTLLHIGRSDAGFFERYCETA